MSSGYDRTKAFSLGRFKPVWRPARLCGKQPQFFVFLGKKLHHVLDISTLDTDILRLLGFYTKDMKYNNAAALFADRNTFSGVDIVRFGETINVILEREMISNTLPSSTTRHWNDTEGTTNMKAIEGSLRQKRELVPEDAFRKPLQTPWFIETMTCMPISG